MGLRDHVDRLDDGAYCGARRGQADFSRDDLLINLAAVLASNLGGRSLHCQNGGRQSAWVDVACPLRRCLAA
jgi:hypothetical protein